ncbi:MAG: hypothetical protein H7X71_08930 [Chitinophagales bacterium]|nr:hypothetical protein [Chitinophagales bacterium]
MKKFLSKYIEFILLALCILLLLSKPEMPLYGDRICMVMFATLALYYLASGILVFLDKYRITRNMRLLYMFGLWAVAMIVLAVLARTTLVQMNYELLLICVSSLFAVSIFSLFIYNGTEPEKKPSISAQLQPLITRCVIAFFIGIGFLLIDPYTVYKLFGTYRSDAVYIDKIIRVYENPEDTILKNELIRYEEILKGRERRMDTRDSSLHLQ